MNESEDQSEVQPEAQVPEVPQSEKDRLKSRADILTFLALVCLGVAGICIGAAILPHYSNIETPVDFSALYFAGFFCSTAVLFFFFAQLFHIRAALEKPDPPD